MVVRDPPSGLQPIRLASHAYLPYKPDREQIDSHLLHYLNASVIFIKTKQQLCT